MHEREPPYAWVIAAACALIVGMVFGGMVNISVFLQPLEAEFGWPRGEIAAAYSIVTLTAGLGGIVMGHFSDRLPVRRLVFAAALVPGAGFFLLSHLDSPTELYFYHALLGLFGFAALLTPSTT